MSQLRLKRRKIEDPDWEPTVSRLVRITKAPVMLVHFDGRNSLSFQLAGLIMVDLTRTDPKILKRYMGSKGFAAFKDYHREAYFVIGNYCSK